MVPAVALQRTVEEKLPVPLTVAEQTVLKADAIKAGVQVTVTEVTNAAGVLPPPVPALVLPPLPALLLPPPHATKLSTLLTATASIRRRTMGPLLSNFVWIHVGREKLGDIGAAVDRSHVSGLLEDESRGVQENGPSSAMLFRHALPKGLEIGSE